MARRRNRKTQPPAGAPAPAPTPTPSGPGAPASGLAPAPRSSSAPGPPKKTRHTGWILAGLALVGLSGLGALVIALSLVNEVTVLAAARPIEAGVIVEASDFEEVRLPARMSELGVSADDLDLYVGQQTTGPLGQGALVHPDQFTEADGVQVDELVLGLDLGPGYYPQIGLQAGERVRIFELTGGAVGFESNSGSQAVELGVAELVRVTALQQPDRFLFSIRIEAELAARVVDQADQDRITIGLIPGGESVDGPGATASQLLDDDPPDGS